MNDFLSRIDKNNWILLATSFLVIIMDQVSKYLIKSSMYLYESFDVLGDFFRITYVENPGMAFGIRMENKTLFTMLSIVAAIIVFIYLIRMSKEQFSFRFALALIMGGAIGNLIDRLLEGKVVDFFDVEFFDISIPDFSFLFIEFPGYAMTRWPVFNIADSAVTCGMLLIFWYILFQNSPEKQGISSEA
ncbi:MAG: signal peptidase II [Calditrichales bacterium]|nr:MAG: signal peptidase II [Calditrichales bacterium]